MRRCLVLGCPRPPYPSTHHPLSLLDNPPQSLPAVPVKGPTIPQPFHLEADARGARYQAALQERLAAEAAAEHARAAQFRAQELPSSVPFVPRPSERAPTVPEPLPLHTAERVVERQAFDAGVQERALQDEQEEQRRKSAEEVGVPGCFSPLNGALD